MPINNETERRFLVIKPDIDSLPLERRLDIVQTYLVREDEAVQRRVRKITDNDVSTCYYTEKKYITRVTRAENEEIISLEEYTRLLSEADNELQPVIKTRAVLPFGGLRFEIDLYPFSEDYAIMEVELESEKQEFSLPPQITVIKEVTGNGDYSNAMLAKRGAFPKS